MTWSKLRFSSNFTVLFGCHLFNFTIIMSGIVEYFSTNITGILTQDSDTIVCFFKSTCCKWQMNRINSCFFFKTNWFEHLHLSVFFCYVLCMCAWTMGQEHQIAVYCVNVYFFCEWQHSKLHRSGGLASKILSIFSFRATTKKYGNSVSLTMPLGQVQKLITI